MSPEQFILSVITAYRKARKPYVQNTKISRGRSHSVSSNAEDLFADYLLQNDNTIEHIYVDQPISYKDTINSKTTYPDLAIVKDHKVSALIDLKMDLGWNRYGLKDLCEKHLNVLKAIQGSECSMKDGEKKTRKPLFISKNATYNIVIISRRNSGINLSKILDEVKKYEPDVQTFLLCQNEKHHPNDYSIDVAALLEKLAVDERAFSKIRDRI